MRHLTPLLLLSLVVGCSQVRTYQVSLTNQTREPLTFGVVKRGDPFERKWAAPEDVVPYGGQASAQLWDWVPPGKTAVSTELKGRFRRNAEAQLRVYGGKLINEGKLDQPAIMSISRGQPNRLDLPLAPGFNRFIISDDNGQIVATRVPSEGAPPKPQ